MLLDRLENDRSLARFAGQFVPLKMVTNNNPDWNKWARMYPVDGNGIPRLYVIRADGEKLYAGVGSLPGEKLPLMMMSTLQQAGRSFSQPDADFMSAAVTKAKSELDQGNPFAAAVALSALTKFGSPENLNSFAKPAITASEIYTQLVSVLDQQAQDAQTKLNASSHAIDQLAEIITLFEAEAAFKLFPSLKSKTGTLTRNLNKEGVDAETINQADNLVKARLLALSTNPRLRSRASLAYTSVIRKFPNTPIENMARAELSAIEPEAKILQTMPGDPAASQAFRTWTTRDGDFSTTAKYLQQRQGKVQLQKKDGSKVVVEISVLSEADQAYLREQ